MRCRNCGGELDGGERFCGTCGARIGSEGSEDSLAARPEMHRDAVSSGEPPDRRPGPSRKVVPAIACILVLLVACGAFGWKVYRDARKKAEWERAHAPVHFTVDVEAPGYDPEADTPIPVHVSGTDLVGVAVESDAHLGQDGGIDLRRGTYTISFPASPLLSDGSLYAVPGTTCQVTVVEGGVEGMRPTVSYERIEPEDITDEELDAAYSAAVASGVDGGRADELRSGILEARQAGLDRIAEARRRAALDGWYSAVVTDHPRSDAAWSSNGQITSASMDGGEMVLTGTFLKSSTYGDVDGDGELTESRTWRFPIDGSVRYYTVGGVDGRKPLDGGAFRQMVNSDRTGLLLTLHVDDGAVVEGEWAS